VKEENSFKLAEEKFCEMTDFFKNSSSQNLELSELENYAKQNGSELIRRLLIGHLNERGMGDVGPELKKDDTILKKKAGFMDVIIFLFLAKLKFQDHAIEHRINLE
jgi:hypothetical protein